MKEKQMRILVVEDEPMASKLVTVVLSADGHSVDVVDGAADALKAVALAKPDVMLIDLQLPGLNGLGLARKLRENPATREIRMIAITAYPDYFSRREALVVGFDGYIVKPIDTRVLAQEMGIT